MPFLTKIFYLLLGSLYAVLALVAFIVATPLIVIVLFYLVTIPPLTMLINLIFPISWFFSAESAKSCMDGMINFVRFLLNEAVRFFGIARNEME